MIYRQMEMRKIFTIMPVLTLIFWHSQYLTADDFAPKTNTDIRPTDVIHWQGIEAEAHEDGQVIARVRLQTEQEFAIYDDHMKFAAPPGYSFDHVEAPESREIVDPISGRPVKVYAGGDFSVYFNGLESVRELTFDLAITYIGCTVRLCLLPHTEHVLLPVHQAITTVTATENSKTEVATNERLPVDDDLQRTLANKLQTGQLSTLMLFLIVFLGGVLTNLTPCVYPMIPITIRLLARQGASPFASSALYAGGILVTYTILGIAAASTGTLFGSLLANTAFNVGFALVMMALGLSMLGFGNLAALQTVGSRLGSGPASPGNTFLMGTGAGLVAAPCTGPILGLLLGYVASQGSVSFGSLLLFVYSLGFSIPYVFLGGLAAHVAKIKVPSQVQIITKLAFASIMFGLAFYYLRIPAYAFLQNLKGHWWPLIATTSTLGALSTLLALVHPRFAANKAFAVIPTVALGLTFFALSQVASEKPTGNEQASLNWFHDEAAAFALAKETGKPLFVDAWAEWCEACKELEAQVFPDPQVSAALMSDWVLLKIDLTQSDAKSAKLIEKYGIQSLPTLTLIPADGNLTKKQAIVGYLSPAALLNQLHAFMGK